MQKATLWNHVRLGTALFKQALVLIFCQIQEKGDVKCNKLDMVIDPPSATLQCYNFLINN